MTALRGPEVDPALALAAQKTQVVVLTCRLDGGRTRVIDLARVIKRR